MPHAIDVLDVLFTPERLPHKPYCADDLGYGSRIRPLESALKKRYIQINPPTHQHWLCVDVDRAGGAFAWEEAGLPCPNLCTINPQNGYAHLIWCLETPVVKSVNGRSHPLRFFNAVRIAYTQLAGGDTGYAGLITKNPYHSDWKTVFWHEKLYGLDELAQYVKEKLSSYKKKAAAESEAVQGSTRRNCDLFDALRAWAAREVRLFRGDGRKHFEVWKAHVVDKAEKINGQFGGEKGPLGFSEVKATAKSVAKWVWRKDSEAEKAFLARQAAKGSLGGKAKGAANENKRASARLMAAQGSSQRAIAKELGVSLGSINAWLKECE